jgi:SAM-dependent methyltransferase
MIPVSDLIRFAQNWLSAFIEPKRLLGIAGLPRYFADWRAYRRLGGRPVMRLLDSYPCLTDWTSHTPFDFHYFYQSCWAVRKLAVSCPAWHVDIGSSVHMIGVLSAWIPTIFVDCRPLTARVRGLTTIAGDLMALPFGDGTIDSVSCLHVIEHIGLGRYRDNLDINGSLKAAQEILRVIRSGGQLLLSTPIGIERVHFNAHRVFAPSTVISMFHGMELIDFSMVDDKGAYTANIDPSLASGCRYACGMFEFHKR